GQQFAYLLKSQLCLAARNQRAGRLALYLLRLILDRGSDAHPLKETDEIDAARPGGIHDGLRSEHRPLERLARADIRSGGSRFDGDGDARSGEVDSVCDVTEPDELVQHSGWQ